MTCCRDDANGKPSRRSRVYKKSKLYIGICVTYAVILLFNTIIYIVGLAMLSKPDVLEAKHVSTRLVFLALRGLTITGTDFFAIMGIHQTRGSKFWIAFGFTVISLILSIVNSALTPSILSRVDLDFDIMCFFMLLVLIREVYQLKKQEERQTIHGIQS